MSSRSPKRRPRLSASSTATNSRCAFQRLMIMHRRLPELCMDGGLDEAASIEELNEQILYYHSASKEGASVATVGESGSHATAEAVQFAGLCSALLSLPDTLAGSSRSASDETKEVHLAKATLVFIPLESENLKITAIVQVERFRPISSDENHVWAAGSGNLLAIQTSIQKCHDLFCLLRGSIHDTLSSPVEPLLKIEQHDTDESYGDEEGAQVGKEASTYPGMSELFWLRRRLRRLRREVCRSNDGPPEEKTAHLIDSMEERIRWLVKTLPISYLRVQLCTHYDEYLAITDLLASTTGILHHCLTESVPAPMAQPSVTIARDSRFQFLDSGAALRLGKSVQNIIDNAAKNREGRDPFLVGISSFWNGHFVFSHSCAENPDYPWSGRAPIVASRTACLLMEFMSSFRRKLFLLTAQQSGQQVSKAASPPRRMNSGLRRFLSRSFVDEDTIGGVDSGDASVVQATVGGFLPPPPLSMLNISDRVMQVDVPSYGAVWTPLIYLPLGSRPGNSCAVETNLALFDIGDYSFLVHLQPFQIDAKSAEAAISVEPNTTETTGAPARGLEISSSAVVICADYSRALQTVGSNLSNAAIDKHDECKASVHSPQRDSTREATFEAGLHLSFVDRSTQRLVLVSGEHLCNGQRLGRKQTEKDAHMDASLEVLSNIDCRHLFASDLPPNAVSAFDDMMNEVHSRLSDPDHRKEVGVLQLCTYLHEGWAYAHAQNEQELYVFFDATSFVTISDVQHAADRLRSKLFY